MSIFLFFSVPPCHAEMMTYLQGQQNEMPLLGARKPVCDDNGNYAPKQCSGSQYVIISRHFNVPDHST